MVHHNIYESMRLYDIESLQNCVSLERSLLPPIEVFLDEVAQGITSVSIHIYVLHNGSMVRCLNLCYNPFSPMMLLLLMSGKP